MSKQHRTLVWITRSGTAWDGGEAGGRPGQWAPAQGRGDKASTRRLREDHDSTQAGLAQRLTRSLEKAGVLRKKQAKNPRINYKIHPRFQRTKRDLAF